MPATRKLSGKAAGKGRSASRNTTYQVRDIRGYRIENKVVRVHSNCSSSSSCCCCCCCLRCRALSSRKNCCCTSAGTANVTAPQPQLQQQLQQQQQEQQQQQFCMCMCGVYVQEKFFVLWLDYADDESTWEPWVSRLQQQQQQQ